MERIDSGGGFNVMDGVALVVGAAIASVHMLRVLRGDLSLAGWVMLWLAFTWVAVTAAGPFLFSGWALGLIVGVLRAWLAGLEWHNMPEGIAVWVKLQRHRLGWVLLRGVCTGILLLL